MGSAWKSFLGGISSQMQKGGAVLSGREKSVKSLLIFIITTTLNYLTDKEFFKCPGENRHEIAGWSFMFVPGIIMGILLFMSSDRVSQGSVLCANKRNGAAKFFLRTISLSLTYSVLVVLSWVVASLLFTETYACVKLGPAPDTKNKTKLEIYKSKKVIKNAESQIIASYVLLTALVLQFVVFLIHRCFLSNLSSISERMTSMDR